jgi:hypothetical protein
MENEIPKHRSKKNRRKWCKGKEGVEHKPVWVMRGDNSNALDFRCENCNKILDTYWDFMREFRIRYYGEDPGPPPNVGSREPLKNI